MAWSWSHTHEAYDNARRNLYALPVDDLQIIFAEWRAAQLKRPEFGSRWDGNRFNQKRYDKALAYAVTLPDDVLADQIWEWVEEFATCDSGGFNCWVCPSGCHTVPFDLTPEAEKLGELG